MPIVKGLSRPFLLSKINKKKFVTLKKLSINKHHSL